MVKRKLLKYTWSYEDGIVMLTDNFNGGTFHLPIAYLDSFVRASIVFKNAHRAEQVEKEKKRVDTKIQRINVLKDQLITVKVHFKDYKAKVSKRAKELAEKKKQMRLKLDYAKTHK